MKTRRCSQKFTFFIRLTLSRPTERYTPDYFPKARMKKSVQIEPIESPPISRGAAKSAMIVPYRDFLREQIIENPKRPGGARKSRYKRPVPRAGTTRIERRRVSTGRRATHKLMDEVGQVRSEAAVLGC